ncbi:MAG: urease accessory protein UreF, partial [Pseudomonadota bacterium]
MTDPQALLRLTTWLSPAFPTGGFAWSGGLEAAAQSRLIETSNDLRAWCSHNLHHGGLGSEATLLSCAWRGDDVAGLVAALAPSPERLAGTSTQGAAARAKAAPCSNVSASRSGDDASSAS